MPASTSTDRPSPVEVAPDGTITVPSFKLPVSAALSAQAA
jgi:hypothetical protein